MMKSVTFKEIGTLLFIALWVFVGGFYIPDLISFGEKLPVAECSPGISGCTDIVPLWKLLVGVIYVAVPSLLLLRWLSQTGRRFPDHIACKGSGGDPSGRITAWEGVEPLWADCGVCGKSCTIDEDVEKLWVISPHIVSRTKQQEM